MHARTLQLADAPALLPLCAQLGYPCTLDQLERRLRDLLPSPDDGCIGAQGEDGRLVGWVHVQGRHVLESDPYAEIVGLVVDERCRGRGVGRALVAAAETWAWGAGYPELRVRSNVTRTGAHAFYQRLGFDLTKTSHVFAKSR